MTRFHRFTPVVGALLLACFTQAHAQSANRSVVQVPERPAPATATPTTAMAPVTPPLDGTVLMPRTAIGRTGNVANRANATALMGADGGPNAQVVPSGAGPYTALQLAESFLKADANRDGELTRAEFQRLTISPTSFDDMDRDRDGVVTRSEYEDGSR